MKPFCVRTEGISHEEQQELLDLAVDAGAIMYAHRECSRHKARKRSTMCDWFFFGVNIECKTQFADKPSAFGPLAVEITHEKAWDYLQGLINDKGGEMKKEDFLDTKWDARDWTVEMKRRWQERMFEIGFFWGKNKKQIMNINASYYFAHYGGRLGFEGSNGREYYQGDYKEARSFEELFSESTAEQVQSDTATPTASDLLSQGEEILNKRGAEYEKDGNQERSFDSIAAAFNAITGKDLTPAEIALVLQCVKDVRQWSQDRLHEDSVIDGINYAALKGELLYKQYGE